MAVRGGALETWYRLLPGAGLATLALMLCGTVLTLLVAITLARLLGPSGYGVYAFASSLILMLAIPAQLGLPQLVVRETAGAAARHQWGRVRGVWRWSGVAVWSFSVLFCALTVLVLWWLDGDLADSRRQTVLAGLLLVPLIALGNLRGAALRGLHRVVLGQLPEFILRPLFFLLLIVAILMLSPSGLQPSRAMLLHGLAALLAFAIGAAMLFRVRPAGIRARPRAVYQHRSWLLSALPLAGVGAMGLINSNADILMLGALRSDQEVGIYKVVVTGGNLIAFGLQAITTVVSPRIAGLHAAGQRQELQRLVTGSARAVVALALPAVIAVVLLGRFFLGEMFGPAYAEGYACLLIIAAGQLVNATFGVTMALLNMAGHERYTAAGMALGAVSNVLLNALLIPIMGMEGAALATAISMVVWNALLWWAAHKTLGIETSVFGSRSPVG